MFFDGNLSDSFKWGEDRVPGSVCGVGRTRLYEFLIYPASLPRIVCNRWVDSGWTVERERGGGKKEKGNPGGGWVGTSGR